jgi:hypothetical protein
MAIFKPTTDVGSAMLAATVAIGAFNTLLPHLTEVRHADPTNADAVADVRTGQASFALLTVGLGAVLFLITGEITPVAVAIATSILLIVIYEMALRQNAESE